MGIEPNQLKRLITDVLHGVGRHSDEAVDLLMLTAAQESCLGQYLYQLNDGPARGIFQMEPETHRDLFENYLDYRNKMRGIAYGFAAWSESETDLVANIPYQIVVARFQYLRVPKRIPRRDGFNDEFDYVFALAEYWKKYWNTEKGKGSAQEATQNYHRYVLNADCNYEG